MEKYKATHNNLDMEEQDLKPQKSQDEINSENNANTLRNAAKVAKATGFAPAVAAGAAVEGLDKVTGGKSTEFLGKTVTQINKQVPAGKLVQDASNKLSESGIGDTVGQVADMKSGGVAGSAGNASKTTGTMSKNASSSKLNAKVSPTISTSTSSSNKTNSFLSGNGFLTDNVMSFKMNPILKLKLIGIGAGVFLLIMFIIIVIGQKDLQNNAITNLTVFSDSTISSRNCTIDEINSKLIYVGDRRINEISNSVSNTSTFITNNVGGYNFFKNSTLVSLENILSNTKEGVIVLSFDLNDLVNFDLYVNDYKDIISRYPNFIFYVMSLNPVDESLVTNEITNSVISDYNNKIIANFGDKYIDTYNVTASGFSTIDGVSYDDDTNRKVYEYIASEIFLDGQVICSDGSIEDIDKSQFKGSNATLLSNGETVLSRIDQSTLSMLNTSISNDVNNAGNGSGLGVTIAAFDLIQGTMNNGIIIPYTEGGQSNHNGIDGSWGSNNGLDSYGFIMWAMVNGGCSSFNYKNSEELLKLGDVIDPFNSINGDLVVGNDKAMLILRNEGNLVVVAEANKSYGVIFNSYYYSEIETSNVISLSEFYKNGCS